MFAARIICCPRCQPANRSDKGSDKESKSVRCAVATTTKTYALCRLLLGFDWQLLDSGKFSEETLQLTPQSFQVDELWMKKLHDSASVHGWTWLHHLYVGTIELEIGKISHCFSAIAHGYNLSLDWWLRLIGPTGCCRRQRQGGY